MQTSYRFHCRFFNFALKVCGLLFRKSFALQLPVLPELPENYLLISNHVTNYDPIFLGIALRKQMYYVGTENVVNTGAGGFLLRTFLDPIAIPKGGNSAGAVMEILRRLRAGRRVALMAEGNTTWDGCSIPIPAATGKMVRASGASLVTCRIHGAYFMSPRWAYSRRRGSVRVEPVHIYSPEELRAMKPDEINRHISEDIQLDAYEEQYAAPVRHQGRKLAKGLEHALVLCPQCLRFGTLQSRGSRFSCSCGLKGTYDAYAALQGKGFSFTSVRDWFRWQKGYIRDMAEPAEDAVLASDPQLVLNRVEAGKRSLMVRGKTEMTDRVLRIGEMCFALNDIEDMAVCLRGTLAFSLKDGRYFELISPRKKRSFSGLKYKLLYDRFGAIPRT